MPSKGTQSAKTVEALSLTARRRWAQIIKITPVDQIEAVLTSGQNLIGEPPGEPGRGASRLDRHGKPKGFNLKNAIGLRNEDAVYDLHRTTIRNSAIGIDFTKTYRDQNDMSRDATVRAVLKKLPIYHCYENHWPIRAFLKTMCKNSSYRSKKAMERVREGPEAPELQSMTKPNPRAQHLRAQASQGRGGSTGASRTPKNATQVHETAQEFEPENTPDNSDEDKGSDDNEDEQEGGSEDDDKSEDEGSSDDDSPKEPAPMEKKRRRNDPNRNLPGNKNPRAKKLKAGAMQDPVHKSKKASGKAKANDQGNSEAGPGPRTMANQKELARRKAKSRGKAT
ncbi:hypothetical protein RSOLAG1IB_12316 [Rhizoctonia solani AG-1 IB]|uniref:Uncharacterized protein n=1 Tax=Thanatephorus cucumeris (strain AG1-IB / isolate 7/3/14) TaxID=1108050 RepID=A0A0B7FQD3_THACB|nr:hypothetical protein RSOLAG1IB_12316 [Rhizoctonia solani AG-1 IB]